MRWRACLLVGKIAVSISLAATPVAALSPPPPTLIDFEQDTPGAQPDGFASVDSPAVRFYDSVGADLLVGTFGQQDRGAQGLAVYNDTDNSALEIRLAEPTTSISLVFGHDDPSYSNPGDEAVLRLYRGPNFVAERRVVMNRDLLANQRIGYAGGLLFNRAVFKFDVNPNLGLIEIVDNIRIGPLCTVTGTPAPDQLWGTAGDDVICSIGGDDVVHGLQGADIIYTGTGDDIAEGGYGADIVLGEDGDDQLIGEWGADKLFGGRGSDDLDGGSEPDKCAGGPQVDAAIRCEFTVGIP